MIGPRPAYSDTIIASRPSKRRTPLGQHRGERPIAVTRDRQLDVDSLGERAVAGVRELSCCRVATVIADMSGQLGFEPCSSDAFSIPFNKPAEPVNGPPGSSVAKISSSAPDSFNESAISCCSGDAPCAPDLPWP